MKPFTPIRKSRWHRMIEVVKILHFLDHENGLTAYQLAFWLNMKPCGNFYKILDAAKRYGWVVAVKEQHRPGIIKRRWLITPRGRAAAERYSSQYMFPDFRTDLKLSDKGKEGIEDEISF